MDPHLFVLPIVCVRRCAGNSLFPSGAQPETTLVLHCGLESTGLKVKVIQLLPMDDTTSSHQVAQADKPAASFSLYNVESSNRIAAWTSSGAPFPKDGAQAVAEVIACQYRKASKGTLATSLQTFWCLPLCSASVFFVAVGPSSRSQTWLEVRIFPLQIKLWRDTFFADCRSGRVRQYLLNIGACKYLPGYLASYF